MPRTIEVKLYQFDELPTDAAKEKAREWLRELEQQDFEPHYEPFETAAKILGITFADRAIQTHGGKTRYESDIRYSGFCSQGDGASFVGSYAFNPGCSQAIRAEFPTDTTLHKIADDLTVQCVARKLLGRTPITAKITQDSNHYVHANTMGLTDLQTGDNEDEEITEAEEDALLEAMRDFANWIYKELEEQYDWRLSDEQIEEAIRANEYEFDEDGDRA